MKIQNREFHKTFLLAVGQRKPYQHTLKQIYC